MAQSSEVPFEEGSHAPNPFGSELPPVAAAYVRGVGSERGETLEGEDSRSIEAQKERIRRWARRREVQDVAFFEDAEEDARNKETQQDPVSEREGLGVLLSAVEDGDVRFVIVDQATRLTGSLQGFLQLVSERFEPEVRFVSIEDRLDTGTETGRRFLRMLRSFREGSLDWLTERSREGHRRKAESGEHAYGEVPFGYQKDEEDHLEPNPEQAPVVREIFRLREEGESLRSIAGHLTDEEVPTKRGGKWHASTVKSILDNPIYQGRLIYEIEGETIERKAEQLRLIE